MDSRYGRSFSGGSSGGGGGNSHNQYRRCSRSRSRSRDRSHRRRNSRSRSRERSSHYRHTASADKDLYRDLINDDYKEERNYGHSRSHDHRSHRREDNYDNERDQRWRNYDREQREQRDRGGGDYDRGSDRGGRDYRPQNNNGNGNSSGVSASGNNRERDKRFGSDEDSDDSEDSQYRFMRFNVGQSRSISSAICGTDRVRDQPTEIIVFGLEKHITEADLMGKLIEANMTPSSIRVIRKKRTGASRGFAFVKFNTVEEATHWLELTKGVLQLQDQRVTLHYSNTSKNWYCNKCGVYNFKHRYSCFKCNACRVESGSPYMGGNLGNEEVSNIITKRIVLRNLDALTTEEGVLTAMQQFLPDLVKTISKVQISRDPLTQTSCGICYLNFDTLIDSMQVHNALVALEPPLKIDERDVSVSYDRLALTMDTYTPNVSQANDVNSMMMAVPPSVGNSYTLADVPRLAEYSASLYASTPAEQATYVEYYTDYYLTEIKKGEFDGSSSNDAQLTEANSGAAVALSAIQRKQKKMNNIETTATAAAAAAAQAAAVVKATFNTTTPIVAPRGNDGKTYPTPNVTLYQYDETSGYYYDPSTGLYYDAHSQYYYNNETGAYLYWDQRRSTYILATPDSTKAALQEVLTSDAQNEQKAGEDTKKEKTKDKDNKHEKVKVAKKIVKDMEKWAKQLNQKKDYTVVATPQPILTSRTDIADGPTTSRAALSGGAYADVGFSILEKKDMSKLNDYIAPANVAAAPPNMNKLVNAYAGGSDSEDESNLTAAANANDDVEYVDFQKLICLLCKRAFPSLEVLQKHLKMSNLHKENLAKHNVAGGSAASSDDAAGAGLSYRDRAKERRLKYGESDPAPPNRSRERFEHEIKARKADGPAAPVMPISSSNVGSRLLQKMGWSEGQGLGRRNQGRTQIIEAVARNDNAGLGNKAGSIAPGDDYKTYMKKMMKTRYENA